MYAPRALIACSRSFHGLSNRIAFADHKHSIYVALIQRREAGHSHWQNIRHIKAAQDMHKAKQTDKYVRLIETAVRKGGGPDPKLNKMLQYAMENAKRTQVVSNTAIEAAIKRASGAEKQNLKPGLHEIIGENGVYLLLESETANTSKFVHDLKGICKKHKYAISRGGVKEQFFRKGYVIVCGREDGKPLDMDEALEAALEGGCEEVYEIGDETERKLEFSCDPDDTYKLAKELASNGYQIMSAETRFVPFKAIDLSDEFIKTVEAFCDDLEEHPDVTNVYTNIS